jgi:hypothetical protein
LPRELAQAVGATLDIVLVGEARHLPPSIEPGVLLLPQYVTKSRHKCPAFSGEFVERFLHTLGHCSSDASICFILGANDPGEEILRYANPPASDLAVLISMTLQVCDRAGFFRRWSSEQIASFDIAFVLK